ncbi:unnamed protein product [Caenorhabditis auriculariae]|uniref:Transmembrane protein n=1 Tax=Caenorhabditis auriculariae TaxID=2777116 RepID=A0A8S1HAK7_9PELO|nr:unnamed protein product [Caenorhabditis auriculariae]
MAWTLLEPEDEATLTVAEQRLRRQLSLLFRFAVAVFCCWHLFDFLFSSIWMHGYIWSLNLPIDLDMSDKSAGAIVYHQLHQVGPVERVVHAILCVLGVAFVLLCVGFGKSEGQTTWKLLRVSIVVGFVTGLLRPVQMKQRFFSCLHEGFYCYFMFFVIGLILTFRFGEKFPKKEALTEEAELKKTE